MHWASKCMEIHIYERNALKARQGRRYSLLKAMLIPLLRYLVKALNNNKRKIILTPKKKVLGSVSA